MNRKTIHLIAAARPNFMKIAPLYHALGRAPWAAPVIVHTGQHYDAAMSEAFFRDLGLPAPHIHLGVGSGSHAEQTGRVMMAYEKLLQEAPPDLVVVVGDVNSTMAATLAAVKLGVPVAHLEAGLRSFDRRMPEEINRLVTDSVADLLWTPSPDGDANLLREGVAPEKIQRVGNIMIDSLEMMRPKIEAARAHEELGVPRGGYAVVTLHRPSNVDRRETLEPLVGLLTRLADRLPVVFPIHPRTRASLDRFHLLEELSRAPGMWCTEPLGYIAFMSLVFHCRLALTDSGGLQEETTYLGIPCLTLRENTERPVTVTQGTNRLCGLADVREALEDVLYGKPRPHRVPDLWDGRTAERVVERMEEFLSVTGIEREIKSEIRSPKS